MNECARIASLLAGWVDDPLGDRVASFAEIAVREARPNDTSAWWRRSPSPHHGSSSRSSTAPARPISRLPGWQNTARLLGRAGMSIRTAACVIRPAAVNLRPTKGAHPFNEASLVTYEPVSGRSRTSLRPTTTDIENCPTRDLCAKFALARL
jgi:hypothetical protein